MSTKIDLIKEMISFLQEKVETVFLPETISAEKTLTAAEETLTAAQEAFTNAQRNYQIYQEHIFLLQDELKTLE